MTNTKMLKVHQAAELVDWIGRTLHEISMPSSVRARVAGACFAVAQQHHHALVLLLERTLYASAFALLRVEYEAYIRGVWHAHCATEARCRKTFNGIKLPDIGVMLSAIENLPGFEEKNLARFHAGSWKTMCAFTHTGGLQIQRWITREAIEQNYTEEEVDEILRCANIYALKSAIGVAGLAGREDIVNRILQKISGELALECA